MKAQEKTVEVIATRDSDGALYLYSGKHDVCKCYNITINKMTGSNAYSWVSLDGPSIASGDVAKAMLGGTYRGIRKGGMKRFSVAPVSDDAQLIRTNPLVRYMLERGLISVRLMAKIMDCDIDDITDGM